MLYTRKGDSGTTKVLNSKDRFSKSSILTETLGSIDEVNSFLGLCKVKSENKKIKIGTDDKFLADIIHFVQEDLFIIQAEIAGADMTLDYKKVKYLEEITDGIEKILPPIKTFFISGGTELASLFDIARTIARRAERKAVALNDEGNIKIGENTMAYLNRLSSVLYALARFANYEAGLEEKSPNYKI